MRGRSRITFQQRTTNVLRGHENEAETEDDTRFKLLSRIASQHTQLGNKLKNIGKGMITNARQKEDQESFRENQRLNENTRQTYLKIANEAAAKRSLTDQQKEHIKSNWNKNRPADAKKPRREKQKMTHMTST